MFIDPRKKKINLGGASKTLTKEQLLQKNKQERESRELSLKREASATVISKVYQRYRAKKAALKLIWEMYWRLAGNSNGTGDPIFVRIEGRESEATSLDLLAVLLLCKADATMFPSLASFLESFVFHWNLSDSARLSFLVPRMLTQDGYFSLPLVSRILKSLEIEAGGQSSSGISPKALARVLNCISGPSVTSHLARILQDDSSLAEEKNQCISIILKTMVIGYNSGINVDQQDFIEKTMIIPGFLSSIPAELLKDFPFDALLSSLNSFDLSAPSSTINSLQRLTIFANFLTLASVKLDSMSSSQLQIYLNILNKFMADVPIPDSSNDLSDDSDDDVDMKPASILDQPHLQVLKILYQSSHILKVIKISSQNDIPMTCTFLVGIMSRFRTERLSIASIVLYQHNKSFLRNCLEYYNQSVLAAAIQTDIHAALANPLYTSDWYSLVIVCEFYARLLLTVSNEEFFNSPDTIPLDQLISLTGLLKKVAFVVFWSDSTLVISAPLLSLPYLQDLIPRFLSQIYAKEVRRRFCPDDHWLVSSPELLATLDQLPSLMKGDQKTDVTGLNERAYGRLHACRLILEHIPFIISFSDRVKLFRSFLANDEPGAWIAPSFRAEIRRGQVFEDGYAQLNALGSRLRERIAISFIDQHGLPEAGIDGGGVFKEFLTESLKQAFQPELGLFVETPGHLLYPSPSEYASQQDQLNLFEFLGRIIGKALYERVLLEIPFAAFFLAKWLGRKSQLEDLPLLDEELYNGLIFLKNYQGDVADLCLFFSIDSEELGETKTIAMIPNGQSISVTNENRMKYIHMVANYKLNLMIAKPCRHFFRGLSDLIRPEWLRMFSEAELQILLGGEQAPIKVEEMKKHVVYDGLYDPTHSTIILFWQAVESFSPQDRSLLLKFITSCSRPPLLGFSELHPRICIRFSGQEETRLPTASTCVNLLKLPAYTSIDILREKLLYAIRSQSGFELS